MTLSELTPQLDGNTGIAIHRDGIEIAYCGDESTENPVEKCFLDLYALQEEYGNCNVISVKPSKYAVGLVVTIE